jgi:D-sedoheptulose 7-phosphate isomerase
MADGEQMGIASCCFGVIDRFQNRSTVYGMKSFAETFLSDTQSVLASLNTDEIEAVAKVLAATRGRGGRLFFCGSGGGAGHSSHAACDFRKLGGFEAYCVSDNVSELTARVNDDGWDTSFSNWLKSSHISKNDCLFVFSVGGGSIEPPVSINLVNAILLAQSVGASVVGVVGRDGGALRQHANESVLIPTIEKSLVTPQAEGLQAVIWHLLVSHPLISISTAKWESFESTQP